VITFRAVCLFIITVENEPFKTVVALFTLIFIYGHEKPPNLDFFGPKSSKI